MVKEQKLRREAGVIEFEHYKYELLIRFNKTIEIFPSVTRVLSILLVTSAISASVERANFQGCVA